MDVVAPATRSMDWGKGWEGFTNSMDDDGGNAADRSAACEGDCQPVMMVDYSWKTPTVRPKGAHNSIPLFLDGMIPAFPDQLRLNHAPWCLPKSDKMTVLHAQDFDVRARLARLFNGGCGPHIYISDSGTDLQAQVLEAGRLVYGEPTGAELARSIEEQVSNALDRVSPAVRKAVGLSAAVAVSAAYRQHFRNRSRQAAQPLRHA